MSVHTEKFIYMSSHCDQYGVWRPGEIMIAMQEMGGRQSAALGMSRDEMLARGVIWVLIRNEIQLIRSPKVGDIVVATTWPGTPRRTLYPRYHSFTLEDGTPLAHGSGGWTLADINTHRMAYLPDINAMMPDNSHLTPAIGYPGAVKLLQGEGKTVQRPLLYSDFDLNAHVNNTRVGDWAQDMLGAEILKDRPITHFLANYNREIMPGGPVTLDLKVQGNAFSMTVERDGERLLDCAGKLGY